MIRDNDTMKSLRAARKTQEPEHVECVVRIPLPRATSRWMRAEDSPLGQGTLRALVRGGAIASARPSKHLLVDRDQHDRWIAEHASDRVTTLPGADADGDLDLAIVGRR